MLNNEIRTELFRMVADITYISPKVVYSSYGDNREFIKIGMLLNKVFFMLSDEQLLFIPDKFVVGSCFKEYINLKEEVQNTLSQYYDFSERNELELDLDKVKTFEDNYIKELNLPKIQSAKEEKNSPIFVTDNDKENGWD